MMRTITEENLRIDYYDDDTLCQIIWYAPEMRDDENKIRCPQGWMKLRLWDAGETFTLSQSIKALTGGGDMPVCRGINKKAFERIKELSIDDIVEILFCFKGDSSGLERAFS